MKFGKEFRIHLDETLPAWRDKFLCYKPLKKLLKQLPTMIENDPAIASGDDPNQESNSGARPLVDLQQWFVRILNVELEKLNEFYMDKEEDFVIRLQELKERIERLKDKSSKLGVFSSESEFSEEMMDIRKDFVLIHGEMVLLKNYSSLNFAGLIKILKKYDKRTGGLLRLPFTRLAAHQPFFIIEPLTRLVRECEAILELLFPLEAEVIESSPSEKDPSNQSVTNTTNTSTETTPTLGEETINVYNSTLAAMKAIRGLQKASSTYNPLSFSSFFENNDDDSTGAVTAENSASNSASTLQDKEDADKGDANSV